MENNITASNAKAIAENFIRQHHSISDVQEPKLKDNLWIVGIEVSLPEFKKFHVKVNAKTGLIEGF